MSSMFKTESDIRRQKISSIFKTKFGWNVIMVKNKELGIFKAIIDRGFVIGDGSETDRIVRELKGAHIPIQHGYSQATKKVIVALEQPFRVKLKRRGFDKTFFELRRKKKGQNYPNSPINSFV